jgi:hypothetical protein
MSKAAMMKVLKMQKALKLADEAKRRDIAISETPNTMDKILEFQSRNGLLVNMWYWVRYKDDSDWFPALWGKYGWTNEDCWNETFDDILSIGEWKLIPLPEEIK